MATTTKATIPDGLARIFGPGAATGVEEGRLIERFASTGDASAFEAILARHGPMVWGVCRRSLVDPNDAEDAFQATFLIFARRAGAIRDPGRLGGWLHGVARKVAARARREAARRPSSGSENLADAGPRVGDDLESRERADLLHGEIGRLPDRYRAPIVLCHLEGCTHEEAAERLGWPVGTVRGRLSRGRDRLRDGLARRGLASLAFPAVIPRVPSAPAGAVLKAVASMEAGRIAAGLASPRSVAWLEGVSRTMRIAEMKSIAAKSLLALAATAGAGAYALSLAGAEAPPPSPAPAPVPASEQAAPAKLARPMDWGGGGQGYQLGRDEAEKHSGKSSGTVRSTDMPGMFGTLTQGFQAAPYRGKRLRLSAWVKVDGVEKQSGLWMRVDGKARTPLGFDNMGERPIKGTADWKKYDLVLDIADDAEEIYFGFLLAGKGRAWVDDIAFDVVGKDVPATGMEVAPQPREGVFTPSVPADPKNLGFER